MAGGITGGLEDAIIKYFNTHPQAKSKFLNVVNSHPNDTTGTGLGGPTLGENLVNGLRDLPGWLQHEIARAMNDAGQSFSTGGEIFDSVLDPTPTPIGSTKSGAPLQHGGPTPTPPLPMPTPQPTPTLTGSPFERFFESMFNPSTTYARNVEQGRASDSQRSGQLAQFNKTLEQIGPAMSADRAMLNTARRQTPAVPELSTFMKQRMSWSDFPKKQRKLWSDFMPNQRGR